MAAALADRLSNTRLTYDCPSSLVITLLLIRPRDEKPSDSNWKAKLKQPVKDERVQTEVRT